MKALVYQGLQDVKAENVPDPEILNPGDIIVRVSASSVCGSDLHLLHGMVPSMREGFDQLCTPDRRAVTEGNAAFILGNTKVSFEE